MKKLLTLLMLLPVCSIGIAQVISDTTKTTKTVLSKQVQATQPLQTIKTAGSNTVVEKLPDLRITAATVTAVATGQGVYKLTIVCTIKNEGTAPISLSQISYQGLVAPESKLGLPINATAYEPACGTTAGLARDILQPGASITRDYFCFNRVLSPADKPVYVLLVNRNSEVKELSKDNNRQNVYITFN